MCYCSCCHAWSRGPHGSTGISPVCCTLSRPGSAKAAYGLSVFIRFHSHRAMAVEGLHQLPVENVNGKMSHLWGCSRPRLWPAPPASAWSCKWSQQWHGRPRRWTQGTGTLSSPPGPELPNSGPVRGRSKASVLNGSISNKAKPPLAHVQTLIRNKWHLQLQDAE